MLRREEEALAKARDEDLQRQQRRIEESVQAKRQAARAKRRNSAGDDTEGREEKVQQQTPEVSPQVKESAALTVESMTHVRADNVAGMLDAVEEMVLDRIGPDLHRLASKKTLQCVV